MAKDKSGGKRAKGAGGGAVGAKNLNGSQVDMTEYEANKKVSSYEKQFEPYVRGQISKYEAGTLYKAVKNGDVKALPETTSMLYDGTTASVKTARERYSQDHQYYDRVNNMTTALMNNDYKSAQVFINAIEADFISHATKKSRYYKYRQQ